MKQYAWLLVGICGFSTASFADSPTQPYTVFHQPTVLSPQCGDGQAKLYDECGDQAQILRHAIAQAKAENKLVLIVYGGEWCIWCHVLDKYFHGQYRTFDYNWRANTGEMTAWEMQEAISPNEILEATALNKFVAENFVIAHIESQSKNAKKAISSTGFDPKKIYYFPFIMVLNAQGKYVAQMPSTSAIENFEIRQSGGQEYRGYNRQILLEQLKMLKNKAISK